MHVLHFITGLDTRDGGPSVAIEGLTKAQRGLGARVSLIATYRADDDPARSQRLKQAGIEIRLLGPTRDPLQRVTGMKKACRKAVGDPDRPDIVHIHNTWEDLQHHASRAAYAAGVPYVFRPCGMLDPWSLRQSRHQKRAMLALRVRTNLNRAAALHYSTAVERDGAQPLGLTAPAIVEPNGVNLEDTPRYTADHLRQVYRLGPGPVLLFLGRLHPQKGLYVLADAFRQVLDRWPTDRPRPSLLLAGPDEENTLGPLTAHLETLGCREQVVFTGPLTGHDKARALQGSDLFCLPSYLESFGLSVVEALAAGTPALVSDQVGLVQEIEEAGVGASTPVDAEAYGRLIEQWLYNDRQRAEAAKKAGPWAHQTYNWNRIADAWLSGHYPRLAGHAHPAPAQADARRLSSTHPASPAAAPEPPR